MLCNCPSLLIRSVLIKSDHKCNVCNGRLLSQAFYMFPCRHAFHRDCLASEVSVILTPEQRSVYDGINAIIYHIYYV